MASLTRWSRLADGSGQGSMDASAVDGTLVANTWQYKRRNRAGWARHLRFYLTGRLIRPARAASLPPEGQEHNDLVPDLFFRHVLRDEQDVVDGRADGLRIGRGDDPRQGLSRRHAF